VESGKDERSIRSIAVQKRGRSHRESRMKFDGAWLFLKRPLCVDGMEERALS
jgi:hypothetical protein